MEPKKLSTKFLQHLDETVTQDEFKKAVEELMKFLVSMQQRNDQEIKNLQETYAHVVNTLKNENAKDISASKEEIKAIVQPLMDKMMSEHQTKMKAMDEKMDSIVDGTDGQDADEERVMEMVLAKIPPVKELERETPATLRDKLEMLSGEDKLSIQAIGGLSKMLEELGNKGSRIVRGGVGPLVRFIDDETPTGSVNGVNKIFTISKFPISGSLKVYVNGQRVRVTTDYTFSGKTITFLTAPPTGSILLVDFRY